MNDEQPVVCIYATGDYSFDKYPKLSEKLAFSTPWYANLRANAMEN